MKLVRIYPKRCTKIRQLRPNQARYGLYPVQSGELLSCRDTLRFYACFRQTLKTEQVESRCRHGSINLHEDIFWGRNSVFSNASSALKRSGYLNASPMLSKPKVITETRASLKIRFLTSSWALSATTFFYIRSKIRRRVMVAGDNAVVLFIYQFVEFQRIREQVIVICQSGFFVKILSRIIYKRVENFYIFVKNCALGLLEQGQNA